MSCSVGHRRGSDPVLLWLWGRLGATAPIRPLAWEPPYAEGVALKQRNQKKGKNNKLPGKTPSSPAQFRCPIHTARGTGISCQGGWEKECSGVFSYLLLTVEEEDGFGGQLASQLHQLRGRAAP